MACHLVGTKTVTAPYIPGTKGPNSNTWVGEHFLFLRGWYVFYRNICVEMFINKLCSHNKTIIAVTHNTHMSL